LIEDISATKEKEPGRYDADMGRVENSFMRRRSVNNVVSK
jgi:hypothetical protein